MTAATNDCDWVLCTRCCACTKPVGQTVLSLIYRRGHAGQGLPGEVRTSQKADLGF